MLESNLWIRKRGSCYDEIPATDGGEWFEIEDATY